MPTSAAQTSPPDKQICRACSYSNDGLPLRPVAWPCAHATPGDRLAAAVTARRTQLGYTKTQLARLAGIGLRTVHLLEDGTLHRHRDATLSGLDRGLYWAPGSAAAVLDGGQPDELLPEIGPEPYFPPEARVVLNAGLPVAVEEALVSHLAARRQDMEAALEAEATMLVRQLGKLLPPRARTDDQR